MKVIEITVSTKPKAKDLNMHHQSPEYRALEGTKTTLKINMEELTEKEVMEWASKPIVIDWQSAQREKGTEHVWGLSRELELKAPRPGESERVAPFTRQVNDWIAKGLTEEEATKLVKCQMSVDELYTVMERIKKEPLTIHDRGETNGK